MKTNWKVLAASFIAVVVAGCGSGSGSGVVDPEIIIIGASADNELVIYSIDSSTGELSNMNSIAFGQGAQGFAANNDSNVLYVANADVIGSDWEGNGSVGIFDYTANPTSTMPLLEFVNSPVALSDDGMALKAAITPGGEYVYFTDQDDYQLHVFAADAAGELTETGFSPIDLYEAHGIVMHPSGAFVYVGNEDGYITGYEIDYADGNLTDVPGMVDNGDDDAFETGHSAANALSITPDGSYLYSSDSEGGGDEISGFSVDPATGELTALGWSPLSLPGLGLASRALKNSVITPDGKFIYFIGSQSDDIQGFSIAADGSLAALAGFPVAAGDFPKAASMSATGKFLYVSNRNDDEVQAFSIDAAGLLTSIDVYPAGDDPKGSIIVSGWH